MFQSMSDDKKKLLSDKLHIGIMQEPGSHA